jgi:Ca2+-binding RTX toxin-like protein
MVRRVALLLTMMAVALILGSGVALAAYFVGTRFPDDLRGTSQDDEMYGLRASDDIRGRGGEDYIEGGTGPDELFGNNAGDEIYGGKGEDDMFGGDGNDYLNSADDRPDDRVDCGGGTGDEAVVDTGDTVVGGVIGGPCETVQQVVP